MYPVFLVLNLPFDGSLTFDGDLTTYTFDVLVWQWAKFADEVRPTVRYFLGGMVVDSYDEIVLFKPCLISCLVVCCDTDKVR